VLKPMSAILACASFAALANAWPSPALAQGNLGQVIRQRQSRPEVPDRNPAGGHAPHDHRPGAAGHSIHNNFYIQAPGFHRYGDYFGYPSAFGYGHPHHGYAAGYGYFGGFYPRGPIIYPPAITVVPHGVPLTAEMLNGTYSTPIMPYGYDFGVGDPPINVVIPRGPQGNAAAQNPPQIVPPPPAPPVPQVGPPAPEDEIIRRVAVLKPSTDAGRLRSDQLMADGDREFANQQYRRAAAKYREAIARAPDYPPSHLRAGHAYIATGDYDLAVTYLAMGFELARTTERPGFSLEDLYRGNNLAKEQHHEALADAVLRQPDDGSLLFLSAIVQHYDGRPLQARDYFRRAAELPGRHQPYARMFLPRAED
jgi:hypothetical protein